MSAPLDIDPVCAFHGLRRSEHHCLYCCLCFRTLTPEACSVDEDGVRWDVCQPCADAERLLTSRARQGAINSEISGGRGSSTDGEQ